MIEVDAKIVFHQEIDEDSISHWAEWRGGEVACISRRVVEDCDPRFVRRDGDSFLFGNLKVRIAQYDLIRCAYYVVRA